MLFENLSVREHILFFSQLKGFSLGEAEAEAAALANMFHLQVPVPYNTHTHTPSLLPIVN